MCSAAATDCKCDVYKMKGINYFHSAQAAVSR